MLGATHPVRWSSSRSNGTSDQSGSGCSTGPPLLPHRASTPIGLGTG